MFSGLRHPSITTDNINISKYYHMHDSDANIVLKIARFSIEPTRACSTYVDLNEVSLIIMG